ncbi:glycosyltransferase [Marinimicrobium sp. C6131]|uniref:glycosyltransferase n=1 Tax=Marinimicrobium sp. C6131 TaxID=3022676 RepID=UPI00223C9C8A|nr:glycosyltransferase [Marinimicrobium sp. C6131]UZJ43911.1 glycosyltransferase [Marinimicrobium sp. C6131]
MPDKTHPLKVMHIISGDLWAGAEVQAYTLISHLREQCLVTAVLLNPGRLADELSQLDIQVIVLDETKMNSAALLVKLRKLMKALRPDIIHTHRQKENVLGSIANLISIRAKCVRTVHGAPEFSPKGLQRVQAKLDSLVGRCLQDAIIAVSDEMSESLEKIFPKHKIHYIANGINADLLRKISNQADFKERWPNDIHIGIIGRIEPVKRVDLFLEMIPLLMGELQNRALHFHIIGDGSLRLLLESQVDAMNFSESIHFHGYRSDIPTCIRSLDAVVMCSDHEGMPMTALEALAIGTPVIAHKVGGMAEILADYPEFLVEEHSAFGYAECLRKALNEIDNYEIKLPDNYTSKENFKSTLYLYKKLVSNQKN